MVGSTIDCSAHIRNSRERALRNTGADRATPTSQGSDGSHRVNILCILTGIIEGEPQESILSSLFHLFLYSKIMVV